MAGKGKGPEKGRNLKKYWESDLWKNFGPNKEKKKKIKKPLNEHEKDTI